MALLGKHIILDMKGCCKDIINNVSSVKNILEKATEISNATLVDVICHHFSPYGITGVAILAESHISIHTWPEHEYAAVDIFLCGSAMNPHNAALYISQAFHAKETFTMELKRGDFLLQEAETVCRQYTLDQYQSLLQK